MSGRRKLMRFTVSIREAGDRCGTSFDVIAADEASATAVGLYLLDQMRRKAEFDLELKGATIQLYEPDEV